MVIRVGEKNEAKTGGTVKGTRRKKKTLVGPMSPTQEPLFQEGDSFKRDRPLRWTSRTVRLATRGKGEKGLANERLNAKSRLDKTLSRKNSSTKWEPSNESSKDQEEIASGRGGINERGNPGGMSLG